MEHIILWSPGYHLPGRLENHAIVWYVYVNETHDGPDALSLLTICPFWNCFFFHPPGAEQELINADHRWPRSASVAHKKK